MRYSQKLKIRCTQHSCLLTHAKGDSAIWMSPIASLSYITVRHPGQQNANIPVFETCLGPLTITPVSCPSSLIS